MKKALKNIVIIAILGTILFTLTGCANVNYDIKLNKDGSADISYVMGYDKSFLTSMGVETTSVKNDDSLNDMKKEAQEKGYTIEEYEDETTFGFKASKHVNNIQEEFDLENSVIESDEESNKIVYEKTLLKTTYSQNAKVDLTTMLEDNNAMLKVIVSQMKISYKITLPFKVGSNNATTVSEDGKVLEWTLKVGEVNEIQFEASQDYGIYGLVGIALVLLIAAIIGTVVLKKSKKTVEVKSVEVKKEDTLTEEESEVIEEVEVKEVEDAEAVVEENTVGEAVEDKEEKVEEIPNEEVTIVEETAKEDNQEKQEPVTEDENKEE